MFAGEVEPRIDEDAPKDLLTQQPVACFIEHALLI
jgi:hypothetical protein